MEKNITKQNPDAGSMLSQKTNEDFNKKKPDRADLIKSKTYQKDKIHSEPDEKQSIEENKADQSVNPKSQKKTDDTAGVEFIDKE